MNKPSKSFSVIALLALAFALRVAQLDYQPLWWDEGYTVFFATRDFGALLARTALDIHPPLYYALLQSWLALVGNSVAALRSFSVVVGIAALPFSYLVARQLFNRRVGLLAACLLALSPLHIYYSQEVRMYGLVTLLTLASLASQLAILQTEESAQSTRTLLLWCAYTLTTAAALYTQYYAAFVIAAEIAVVACRKTRTRLTPPLRAWLGAWLAIFLLYLPWLVYAGPKLYTYVTAKVGIEHYSRLDPLTFLANHLAAFSISHLSGMTWLAWVTLLFVALIVFGLYRHAPNLQRSNLQLTTPNLPILLFGVLLLLGYLVNLAYTFHPIRYERLLLFAAPLFYILVARGLDTLLSLRPRVAYAAIAVMTVSAALSLYDFYTVARYPDEDYRPLIRTMADLAQRGDTVLALYPWQIGYLEAYYRGAALNVVEVPGDAWLEQGEKMERALDLGGLRAANARVWLLAYQVKGRILEDQIANFFAHDYRVADEWFGNTRLEYFARGADPPLNENALIFAPDLKLVAYGVGAEPLRAGEGIARVRLHWRAGSNSYSYSLRVVDGTGQKQAQHDAPIAAGDEIERRGILIPRALAPGQYTLRLVVYARANGNPLSTLDGQTEIELAPLPITATQ